MALIEIDIDNYLSEEEKKEICENVFRQACVNHVITKSNDFNKPIYIGESDVERIAGNAVHYMLVDKINEMFNMDYSKIVEEKTLDAVKNKDYKFEVFYDGTYGKEGLGHTYMTQAIKDNKKLIEEKVKEAIENFNYNKCVAEEVKNLLENVADKFGEAMYGLCDLIAKKTNED